MRKTESGYLVKIEVFIPADPRRPETMAAASRVLASIAAASSMEEIIDIDGIPNEAEAGEPRWIARRKSVPTPSVPACEPAPGVSPIPQVQESRAGDDTPADIPSVSSPAGDMPDIPVAMRRVPRT